MPMWTTPPSTQEATTPRPSLLLAKVRKLRIVAPVQQSGPGFPATSELSCGNSPPSAKDGDLRSVGQHCRPPNRPPYNGTMRLPRRLRGEGDKGVRTAGRFPAQGARQR